MMRSERTRIASSTARRRWLWAFPAAALALALTGVPATYAAAATGHATHAASSKAAKKDRIGPMPKALRSLPGAPDALYNYTTKLVVPWTARPAPCPGPRGGTLRPKSITKPAVLATAMRGWCPLHAGDVLMYVPNADVLTRTNPNFTLPAGTVISPSALRKSWTVLPKYVTSTSYVSTGARSFTITPAVAKALKEAYTTMRNYGFGSTQLVFATFNGGQPVTPAELPERLAHDYVDRFSPYYAQVARGLGWSCTIHHPGPSLALALSQASTASSAGTLATRGSSKADTTCAYSHHYRPATTATLYYDQVQVTPAASYFSSTPWPAGFFVETNKTRTRVYRVWVPWASEVSADETWINGPTRYLHSFTSGWAELRPARPTTTDPRTMQVWQPLGGLAAWPSGFVAGWTPTFHSFTFACTTPSTTPSIVLSTASQRRAPALSQSVVASRSAFRAAICHPASPNQAQHT